MTDKAEENFYVLLDALRNENTRLRAQVMSLNGDVVDLTRVLENKQNLEVEQELREDRLENLVETLGREARSMAEKHSELGSRHKTLKLRLAECEEQLERKESWGEEALGRSMRLHHVSLTLDAAALTNALGEAGTALSTVANLNDGAIQEIEFHCPRIAAALTTIRKTFHGEDVE